MLPHFCAFIDSPFPNLQIKVNFIKQNFYHLFIDSNVHQHHSTEAHQAIGIALLLGFVFMLLVDQIGGASHSHAPDNIRLGWFALTL